MKYDPVILNLFDFYQQIKLYQAIISHLLHISALALLIHFSISSVINQVISRSTVC